MGAQLCKLYILLLFLICFKFCSIHATCDGINGRGMWCKKGANNLYYYGVVLGDGLPCYNSHYNAGQALLASFCFRMGGRLPDIRSNANMTAAFDTFLEFALSETGSTVGAVPTKRVFADAKSGPSGYPTELHGKDADGKWGYGDGNGNYNLDGKFATSGLVKLTLEQGWMPEKYMALQRGYTLKATEAFKHISAINYPFCQIHWGCPDCLGCGGEGKIKGVHEAETKGNSVNTLGKCKAKCTASPTCASFTWHESTLRQEVKLVLGIPISKTVGEDHICRLFPEDPSLYVEKPSHWKFGPRTCLSNFNPACWVFDRVERGIPVGSVPNLFEIGECSIACKNHGSCDYFVWYPRTVVSSYFYNDCMLGKRVTGEMVTEVGKITGYPGLAPGDCPTMTAPQGWVGCAAGHGDHPEDTPMILTDDEKLLLNTRQCVELCRSNIRYTHISYSEKEKSCKCLTYINPKKIE